MEDVSFVLEVMALRFLALILLLGGILRAADEASLRATFETHHWFDLRDAVVAGKAPSLYRLLVAVAFDNTDAAENELKVLLRSARREEAADAYYALYRLYIRRGRYAKAVAELREMAAADSERTPGKEEMAVAETLARLPDLKVVSRAPATLATGFVPESRIIAAPLTINGKSAQFTIDVAAGMCGMTESEAARLDLQIVPGSASFGGAGGGVAKDVHYAVAERMKIGNTEIRSAAFVVVPDSRMEMLPLGQRGAIGLPVILALETLRWKRNQELTIGFPAQRGDLRHANLAFDAEYPVTTAEIKGRRVTLGVDSGGKSTYMWPMFARDFAANMQTARKDSVHWVGADGPVTMDAMLLPELRFKLGAFPVALREAAVLLETTKPVTGARASSAWTH